MKAASKAAVERAGSSSLWCWSSGGSLAKSRILGRWAGLGGLFLLVNLNIKKDDDDEGVGGWGSTRLPVLVPWL